MADINLKTVPTKIGYINIHGGSERGWLVTVSEAHPENAFGYLQRFTAAFTTFPEVVAWLRKQELVND